MNRSNSKRLYPFATVIFVALLATALPSPVRAQNQKFDSGGTQISYQVRGAGTPVLLIHGFAVSGIANWSVGGIIDRLAENHQVIVMDVRGHGLSSKPHSPADYGVRMVDDVTRLLDHLQIRKAHIAGYSMGGLITLKLATLQPDRFLSATVAGAGWLRPDQEEAPEFIDQVATSLEQGHGPLPLLQRLNGSSSAVNQARIAATNLVLKSTNDCDALACVFRSLPQLSIAPAELQSCRVPTQFIVGTKDPAPTSVEQLKQLAPTNFRIVEIPNADHVTTMASPRYWQSLSEFIDQHEPQSGSRQP